MESTNTSEIVPYKVAKNEGNPGFLECVGLAVFSLARHAVEKVDSLPYPIGPGVEYVEDLVSAKLASVSVYAEQVTFQVLASADEQVEWAVNTIEKCVQTVMEVVQGSKHILTSLVTETTDRITRNFLIEYAANLLVKYEIVVRNRTHNVLYLVLNLPPLEVTTVKSSVTIVEHVDEHDLLSSPSKRVEEITPVVEDMQPIANFADEADELSKLIDTSWCLGSPRIGSPRVA